MLAAQPIVLLLSLWPSVSGLSAIPGNDTHAAIVIDDPSDLLVPDAISGSGVRGGSGTSTDPFVLENWKIEFSGAQGILIDHISVHVLIRNVEIFALRGNDDSVGIRLRSSSNVDISGVHVVGPGAGIFASDSNWTLHDAHLENLAAGSSGAPRPERPWGADAIGVLHVRGSVTLEGNSIRNTTVAVVTVGGPVTMSSNSFELVRDGSVHSAPNDGMGGQTGALIVRDNTFRGLAGHAAQTPCSANTWDASSAPGVAVNVAPASLQGFELRRNTMEHFGFGVLIGAAAAGTTERVGSGTVADNAVSETSCGIVSLVAGEVSIEANHITENYQGLGLAVSVNQVPAQLSIRLNRITGNAVGVTAVHASGVDSSGNPLDDSSKQLATGSAARLVAIARNDIVDNGKGLWFDTRGAPPQNAQAPLRAKENYWGVRGPTFNHQSLNALDGPIDVNPFSETPFTGFVGAPAKSSGTPGPSALLLLLAITLLAGACRLRRA